MRSSVLPAGIVLALLLATSCSKKKDELEERCPKFVTKSLSYIDEKGMIESAEPKRSEEIELMISMCRTTWQKSQNDMIDCVVAAANEATVRKCWDEGVARSAAETKKAAERLEKMLEDDAGPPGGAQP